MVSIVLRVAVLLCCSIVARRLESPVSDSNQSGCWDKYPPGNKILKLARRAEPMHPHGQAGREWDGNMKSIISYILSISLAARRFWRSVECPPHCRMRQGVLCLGVW